MKILFIEDSNDKIERVISRLAQVPGWRREMIDVAYTTHDAKGMLAREVYDLLILDILVPLRAGDQPRSETATELLTELRDRRTLKKPRHIIGLTAFEEGLRALQPIFAQQTWTIIRYDPSSTDWSDQLVRAVTWIQDSDNQTSASVHGIDLAVITALDTPEYDAVLRAGWRWEAAEPLDDTTFVRRTAFISGERAYTAVSACCPKMGMVPAALISAKLIASLRPRFLVICGITAGLKGRTNYGDPVIADPCWDWQRGKHVLKDGVKEFEIRPDQIPLAQEIRSRWEQFKSDREFWMALKDGWPGAPETEIRVRLGPAVSGAAVLADASIIDEIKNQHGGLVGLEMEAYGVLAAASLASRPRPVAFSCKSVCDFGDEKKDDRWQTYAAYTSARSITAYFERYMGQLAPA